MVAKIKRPLPVELDASERKELQGKTVEDLQKAWAALGRRGSEYTGVYWEANMKRWRAGITLKGKLYWIGYYVEKADAAEARDKAALAAHGLCDHLLRERHQAGLHTHRHNEGCRAGGQS